MSLFWKGCCTTVGKGKFELLTFQDNDGKKSQKTVCESTRPLSLQHCSESSWFPYSADIDHLSPFEKYSSLSKSSQEITFFSSLYREKLLFMLFCDSQSSLFPAAILFSLALPSKTLRRSLRALLNHTWHRKKQLRCTFCSAYGVTTPPMMPGVQNAYFISGNEVSRDFPAAAANRELPS